MWLLLCQREKEGPRCPLISNEHSRLIHLIFPTIRWLKLVTWPYSTTRRLGSGHLLSARCEDNFWWAAQSWQAMLMRATALWDIVLTFTIQYGLVKTWPHSSMIWVSIWEQTLCVYVRACMCVCVCVCVTVGGTRKKGEGQRRGEERRKIMSIYRPNKTLFGNGELSWACVQINPGRPTIKRVWPVWPKMNRPEKPDPRSSSVQEGQQCNSKPAPVAQAPALAVKDNLL